MTTRNSNRFFCPPALAQDAVEKRGESDAAIPLPFEAGLASVRVATLRTASYFDERHGRVDCGTFDRLTKRRCGQTPRAEVYC